MAASDGQRMVLAEHSYSGPLPQPADLQAYELVLPGAAERIMKQFEDQGAHRRELEQVVVRGSERRGDLGQWLAFVLMLSGVVGGCIVALAGEAKAGAGIGAAAFASGTLIYILGGRLSQSDDSN